MTITDRIKQQGKPLDTIEKECNLGSGTISKWKQSSPSVDNLLTVARYLNVSLDFLVGYDCPVKSVNQSIIGDGNSQNAYTCSSPSSPLEESVLLAMRKMSMETLYDRIKALCQSEGKTIADMCAELGLRKSTLSELKAGRSKTLSLPYLIKISNYFKIPIDYLIGRQVPPQSINQSIVGDENSQNAYTFSHISSPLEESVLLAMRKMSDADKARVVQFAYEIIDKR